MVESYDKLALTPLRDDAARVLRQNFPNSTFLGGPGVAGNAAKPWWKFW
jgi:outer membrane protein assembly factor BamD